MCIRKKVEKFCSEISADRKLVQAAGGNVSWKDEDVLWVKASGTWLADAEKEDIFMPVDLASLRRSFGINSFSLKPTVLFENKLKPSIETMLHAIMPHKIVVHLHPVELLPWLVSDYNDTYFSSKIGKIDCQKIIPYRKPGQLLAEKIYQKLKKLPNLDYLFLQNHGIVFGAESVERVKDLLNFITKNYGIRANEMAQIETSLKNIPLKCGAHYKIIPDDDIQKLATDDNLYNRLLTSWALYPDHVIFLGDAPVLFNSISELLVYEGGTKSPSPLVFVKNVGVYCTELFTKAKLEQLQCYFDVIIRLPVKFATNCLGNNEINELLNWDAEKYRIGLER